MHGGMQRGRFERPVALLSLARVVNARERCAKLCRRVRSW